MHDPFTVELSALQPSQLYVSAQKLDAVRRSAAQATSPLPVKELCGRWVLTDGHTRAVSAHQDGATQILVRLETDRLDWEAYAICVEWCLDAGIRSIPDLAKHVIDAEQYEDLWLDRCRAMHAKLARTRCDDGPA